METESLYKAQVACKVAKITPRTLDYWITTGLVVPHSSYKGPARRRDFFLFGFEELVQLRAISALRMAGLSLPKIRLVVAEIRKHSGSQWQKTWLITEGTKVYLVHDPNTLEEMGNRAGAQLSFAAIALESTSRDVKARLTELKAVPFESGHMQGEIVRLTVPRSTA